MDQNGKKVKHSYTVIGKEARALLIFVNYFLRAYLSWHCTGTSGSINDQSIHESGPHVCW